MSGPRCKTSAFSRVLRRLIIERVNLDPSLCWPWPGSIYSNGYGHIGGGPGDATADRLVHVVMWEGFFGPVPAGLDLDHTCHTDTCAGGNTCPHRRCCNLWHLQPDTRSNNLKRGVNVGGDHTSAAFRARRR